MVELNRFNKLIEQYGKWRIIRTPRQIVAECDGRLSHFDNLYCESEASTKLNALKQRLDTL